MLRGGFERAKLWTGSRAAQRESAQLPPSSKGCFRRSDERRTRRAAVVIAQFGSVGGLAPLEGERERWGLLFFRAPPLFALPPPPRAAATQRCTVPLWSGAPNRVCACGRACHTVAGTPGSTPGTSRCTLRARRRRECPLGGAVGGRPRFVLNACESARSRWRWALHML